MNDMSSAIVPKSDQINADDLIGRTMNITIREVQIKGGQEQPVAMRFDGSTKVYRPCKSMCRVMVAAWGPDARQYIGRSMTLYRDPTIKWGSLEVGGIRISHMSHLERAMTMALTATKGSRKPFVVKPLENAPKQPERTTEPQQDAPTGTFNIVDPEGNPHPMEDAAKWGRVIQKKLAAFTKVSEVKSFMNDNLNAIADVALTHQNIADEVREMLMARIHELEPKE